MFECLHFSWENDIADSELKHTNKFYILSRIKNTKQTLREKHLEFERYYEICSLLYKRCSLASKIYGANDMCRNAAMAKYLSHGQVNTATVATGYKFRFLISSAI